MKFKELETTANVVWSPNNFYPVTLATGSAAQHVDASFSSSASLELHSLNLGDPSYEMEHVTSVPSEHKFQKLVWSSGGVLVGGCDGGLLKFYSVDNILKKKEPLVASNTKHTGSVSALDLNPFQNNLFASGASDSEIYIWDLNNTTTPMAPGTKSQPNEHVQALAWNRQVQHILASSFATRCIVWDLRKNEPIIKLCDGQARTKWKAAVWHPTVATQLCLASEDDLNPVVQLWDLRLATSPLLSLERHQKGVLALSWCQQDPDLLLSASKDGKVLCWNPNNNVAGGEVLSELCSTGQWMFDVQWCPKNPNLVATCSNDGRVGIYSINGGAHLPPVATSNKIMDSFPGMESLHQAPVPSSTEIHSSPQILPRPPQWSKRPVRASFGFGGKLVSFGNYNTAASGQNGVVNQREIFISQVITEPELVTEARSLQEVIAAGGAEGAAGLLTDYCHRKGDQSSDQHDRYIWHFLKANFEQNPRAEMLNLLGFRSDDMNAKLNAHFAKVTSKNQQNNIDGQIEQMTDRLSGLSRSESPETDAEPSTDTSTDISGTDATTAFDNIAQLNKINSEISTKNVTETFNIPMGDDPEGLICQALMSGNTEIAVELCMDAGRTADALIIASTGGTDLLQRTQWRYLSNSKGAITSLSSALLGGNWKEFATGVSSAGWKPALAAALTHCTAENLYTVCEIIGDKLDKESDPTLFREAIICYLCSASVEKLVAKWQKEIDVKKSDAKMLTRIAELVLVSRLAAMQRGRPIEAAGNLSHLLSTYAMKLASQGFLDGALTCLSGLPDQELVYRLQCALGYAQPYQLSNMQATQRNVNQNHLPAATRVRTSSYKTATQQDIWGTTPQPASYAPNNLHQTNAQYNSSVDQIPQSQTSYGFAQPTVTPTLPPTQPPRPTSASSHGGLIGRNKYLRDPSVQSGAGSFQPNSFQPAPIDTQPGFNSRQNFMQPGAMPSQPAFNPQPNTMLNPAVQPSYNTAFNTARNYNQAPSASPVPAAPVPSKPPSVLNPMSNNMYASNMNPPEMQSNGMGNNQYYNEPENAVDAIASAAFQGASGWNDPPPLTSSKAQPSLDYYHGYPKPEYVAPAPITHPLFGSVAPQHVPLSGGAPFQQNFQDPVSQQYGQNYGGQMPNQPPMSHMPVNQPEPQVENIVKSLPAPIQKAPIPEQHIHMQTVFDALRAQCAQSINNPQIKRKLDDVQRKLETLYDLLRENRLSENAINILHGVVQMVQTGDYANALATLTSLATGPDFSTVASFLPSLKIMIQTASNSQIYLR